MNNLGRITIIVPVYNVEQFISKCIESILTQTYTNLQILLIDDGSVDHSGRICDSYAEQDTRIEVFHTNNRGLVAARKLGISHAEGDYIGFVDGDDYIEPTMYEFLIKKICESGADFVHAGYVEERGNQSKKTFDYTEGIFDLHNTEEREMFLVRHVLGTERSISPSIWSKLYNKELIQNSYFLLPDEQQYGEDLFSLCLCILRCTRIAIYPCALYHYVIREQSMSRLPPVEYAIKEVELNYTLINVLKKYNSQSFEGLKEHICYFMMRKFASIIKETSKKDVIIPSYYWKNAQQLRGKKIVIYGAGVVGQDYYVQLSRYSDIEIVAWLDSSWHNCSFDYANVIGIDMLSSYDFDTIIIAVKDEMVAKEIRNMLTEYGVLEEKITWTKPGNIL